MNELPRCNVLSPNTGSGPSGRVVGFDSGPGPVKTEFPISPEQVDLDDDRLQLEMLLIYEDVSTALRAKSAVAHVLDGPEARANCHIHAWKMDMLHHPECNAQAERHALSSDIIVLATHGTENSLNSEMALRLNDWISVQRDSPCALIISLDSEAQRGPGQSRELTDLCSAARRYGMTVIFQTGEPIPSEGDQRSPSHWGINE